MAVSYPLTLPTDPGIITARIFVSFAVAISESPFTFTSETQVHSGSRWGAEFTLPVMTRAQAEVWQCILLQLNGIAGSFYLGDSLSTEPRGNWSGIPVVNGGSQEGTSIDLKGFVPGATIAAGDQFQIGLRLYKHIGITTVVADGSGHVTLDIFPRLRESPADNSGVITNSPKGIFRLSSNEYGLYDAVAMEYYSVSFSALEAL